MVNFLGGQYARFHCKRECLCFLLSAPEIGLLMVFKTHYHGVKSGHNSYYQYYRESEPKTEAFRNLWRLKNSIDPINSRRIIFSAFVFSRKIPKERAERMKIFTDYQHYYHYYKLHIEPLYVGLLHRHREVRELID